MTIISINISVENSTNKNVRLGDIRKWLEEVDKFNLPNDYPIKYSHLSLNIEIPEHAITTSLCMACSPKNHNNDVLIITHTCPQQNTTNSYLAEAYDQAL